MNEGVDIALTFISGLLGSMHCVGMCGAIVLAYSAQPKRGQTLIHSSLLLHLVYNGGRVFSYTLFGAMAGLIGGIAHSVTEVGSWFSIVSGSVMIVIGLLLLGLIPRFDLTEEGTDGWLRKLHLQSVASLLSLRTPESTFYVGLLTPLLPCGLLYAMLVKAAATGSAFQGGLTMFLFGSGIVPALLLTGLVSAYVRISLRHYASKLAALTIVLMGITLILRGAGVPFPFTGGPHGPHMH